METAKSAYLTFMVPSLLGECVSVDAPQRYPLHTQSATKTNRPTMLLLSWIRRLVPIAPVGSTGEKRTAGEFVALLVGYAEGTPG